MNPFSLQKKLGLGLVLAAAAMVPVQCVRAQGVVAELELISGTTVVTDDISAGAGLATINQTLGGWNISVSSGLMAPDAAPGSMDLNSLELTSTGTTDPLTILFSTLGNSIPGEYLTTVGGTMSPGVNATFSTFYGAALGDTAHQLTASATMTGPSFSGYAAGVVAAQGPYSLTEQAVVTGAGQAGSMFSFDYNLTPTAAPEPSTISLLAGAAAVAALFRKKLVRP